LTQSVAWLAVDWGTSNVRAWGIGADGEVIFARSSESGMGRIAAADYPAILAGLAGNSIGSPARPLEVLVCGMAGALQGWREAPYLDAPAELATLALGAVVPPDVPRGLSVRILPGVCQKGPAGEDVMRGEETQLLGLSALLPGFSGLAVLPGTHCKWAEIDGHRLQRFGTAMTGEVFEALAGHTVLRHSLAGDADEADVEAGFSQGLEDGLNQPQRLLSLLFRVRSSALLSGRNPGWCRGLLSGLLIGSEIAGFAGWGEGEVPLIGSPGLCRLYARGLSAAGRSSRVVDATEATLGGLRAARGTV
jgi:2-dehydro-3-deoxygalactonokinase